MRRNQRTAIVWALFAAMALSASMLRAQAPATETSSAAASAKLDLGYITPGTVAAVVLHPQRVLKSPDLDFLPTEVISAAGLKELGIDPVEIEQVLVIAEAAPGKAGIVLRMASPPAKGKIIAPIWAETTETQLDGKTYQQGKGPMAPGILRIDDRTLLVANDEFLHQMLSSHAKPQEGKMTQILAHIAEPPDLMAIVLVEPLRPMINPLLGMFPLPPDLADAKKIPDLLSSIGVKANLTGEVATASLTLRAKDEDAAKELETILDKLLAAGRQSVSAQTARQAASSDPVEQAMAKYSQRMSERMLKAIRPVRKGQNLTLSASGSPAIVGVAAAFVLPAISYARLRRPMPISPPPTDNAPPRSP
jgi:hypothetical protein